MKILCQFLQGILYLYKHSGEHTPRIAKFCFLTFKRFTCMIMFSTTPKLQHLDKQLKKMALNTILVLQELQ